PILCLGGRLSSELAWPFRGLESPSTEGRYPQIAPAISSPRLSDIVGIYAPFSPCSRLDVSLTSIQAVTKIDLGCWYSKAYGHNSGILPMAARENQGLQIAVMIFFLLVVVLAVTTYLFFSDFDAEHKAKAKLEDDLAKQTAASLKSV